MEAVVLSGWWLVVGGKAEILVLVLGLPSIQCFLCARASHRTLTPVEEEGPREYGNAATQSPGGVGKLFSRVTLFGSYIITTFSGEELGLLMFTVNTTSIKRIM